MKKRKAFISWSGAQGECLGNRIREWLPIILPGFVPYFSAQSGPTRDWLATIERELTAADLALICVTRDSLASPWLHFETGALWLSKCRPSITLVLLDVSVAELEGPLAVFSAVVFNEREVHNMCRALSKTLKIDGDSFKKTWIAGWPCLERDVASDIAALKKRSRQTRPSIRGAKKLT
jgi:hypothetical protein